MTENERLTIDEIIQHCSITCENTEMLAIARGQNQEDITSKGYWEHYQVANYLEKLKQYRAIGTVEELKSMKENGAFSGIELAQIASMQMKLKEYQSIGTIEEFKALKEKAEAKKPILNNPKIDEFYVKEAKLCPSCHSYINDCSGDYCRDCGQKLDWSE